MLDWFWLILITAYGACVGSFLNVVIYRLPREENLVTPRSACPKCGHKLAACDNVPVLGWLWLGGRCRYCREAISIQYPIVELITASLFGGVFAIYYMTDLWPLWNEAGLLSTWPMMFAYLMLVAALVAATVIDGKLYIIPLAIPRVVTILAVVGLPIGAYFFEYTIALGPAAGLWGQEQAAGAAAGGVIGLVIANILLAVGLLPVSFSKGYEIETDPSVGQDDRQPRQEQPARGEESDSEQETWNPWMGFGKELLFVAVLLVLAAVLYVLQQAGGLGPDGVGRGSGIVLDWVHVLMAVGVLWVLCLVVGLLWLWRGRAGRFKLPGSQEGDVVRDEIDQWLVHPNARREVLKECLFLAWPVAGVVLGVVLLSSCSGGLPGPVTVLAASVCGYLAGGGIVWMTRVGGTLLFGKEAMGLGDVHLLGAVGAVLGISSVLEIFFVAPFFGIAAAIIMAVLGRLYRGRIRVIPYGPYLAAATAVVLIFGAPRIFDFAMGLFGFLGMISSLGAGQ